MVDKQIIVCDHRFWTYEVILLLPAQTYTTWYTLNSLLSYFLLQVKL